MKKQHLLLGGALVGLSLPALAHTGHAVGGFWQGVMHPLTGLDHLAAMLFLGVWLSSLSRGVALKSIAAVAAVFFGSIFLAGHLEGSLVRLIELSVLASALVLAGLAFARAQLGVFAPVIAASLLACHGLAHATEAVGTVSSFAFGAAISLTILVLGVYALGLQVLPIRTKTA